MFDVSASELLVIGAVALIVIGPKELPGVLRMVGQTVGKLKRMAGDFRTQFDDAMREADMHEIKKTVSDTVNTASSATSFNPISTIRNEIKSTVDEIKGATTSAEAAVVAPVKAVAEDQGPPVMTLDPVPEPAPVRFAPETPTPAEPTTLKVAADPVEEPAKPKRAPKKKSGGDAA